LPCRSSPPLPKGIAQALDDLGRHGPLVDRLTRALAPDLPVLTRDGGFIAPGYAPELDQLRTLRDESIAQIAGKILALERGEPIAGLVDPARGY